LQNPIEEAENTDGEETFIRHHTDKSLEELSKTVHINGFNPKQENRDYISSGDPFKSIPSYPNFKKLGPATSQSFSSKY
jgi:hypothetical protein